jgi:hypothetical protein
LTAPCKQDGELRDPPSLLCDHIIYIASYIKLYVTYIILYMYKIAMILSVCSTSDYMFRPFSEASSVLTPLKPNYPYRGRTALLTSKRFILYIYSTNIGTEYFKHGIYSPFFPSSKCCLFHNSNVFGSCVIHILYIGCAKIKKK